MWLSFKKKEIKLRAEELMLLSCGVEEEDF